MLPLPIFKELKREVIDTRIINVLETMSRQFKQEVLFRVTVDVNGKQEYAIHTRDYDELCDKLTDVMIKETL